MNPMIVASLIQQAPNIMQAFGMGQRHGQPLMFQPPDFEDDPNRPRLQTPSVQAFQAQAQAAEGTPAQPSAWQQAQSQMLKSGIDALMQQMFYRPQQPSAPLFTPPRF